MRKLTLILIAGMFFGTAVNAQQSALYVGTSPNFTKIVSSGAGTITMPSGGGTLLAAGDPIPSGTAWNGTPIGLLYGGTGQTTASAALNALLPTQSVTTVGQVLQSNGTTASWQSAGGGSGTVTTFSSGDLSPLFTTSVATQTTTPALSFTLSNTTSVHTFLGNNTGTTGPPTYTTVGPLDLSSTAGTASATTFYCGNGTWATPSGGGGGATLILNATNTGTETITNNSTQSATFTTYGTPSSGSFDGTTFTVGVSGLYLITANFATGTSGAILGPSVVVNGVTYVYGGTGSNIGFPSPLSRAMTTAVVSLSSGDAVLIKVSNGGGTSGVLTADGTTRLTITKLN